MHTTVGDAGDGDLQLMMEWRPSRSHGRGGQRTPYLRQTSSGCGCRCPGRCRTCPASKYDATSALEHLQLLLLLRLSLSLSLSFPQHFGGVRPRLTPRLLVDQVQKQSIHLLADRQRGQGILGRGMVGETVVFFSFPIQLTAAPLLIWFSELGGCICVWIRARGGG